MVVAVAAVVASAFSCCFALKPGSYGAVAPARPVPPRTAIIGLSVVAVVVVMIGAVPGIMKKDLIKTSQLQ